MKFTLCDIEQILWDDFKSNPRRLNKTDVDSNSELPSYNSCNRQGLSLSKLNKEFQLRQYLLNPKKCECCGVTIPKEKSTNKYCSSSCAATVNNSLFHKKIKRCLNCNCVIDPKNSQTKYCSSSCHHSHQFEYKFLEWYHNCGNFSNRLLRKFLEVIHGYKCYVCGISSWNEKEITLEVEHIDGNSENNHRDNLCLICPNCHSQTDTYKGKNKGNGRHLRRERYAAGKSY